MRPQSSGRLPSAWRLPWMRQPALRPARRPAQRPARRRPARRPPARRLLHLQRAPSRHPGRFGRRSPRATTAKLSSTARGRASASWAPCTPASPTRCTALAALEAASASGVAAPPPREVGADAVRGARRPVPMEQRLARGVCTFYAQGRCNRGDRCKFAHVDARPISGSGPSGGAAISTAARGGTSLHGFGGDFD